MRQTLRQLRPLLPHRGEQAIALIAAASLAASFSEAVLLVMVVGSAAAIADGASSLNIGLPLGPASVKVEHALGLAVASGIFMMVVHTAVAHVTATLSSGVLERGRQRLIRAFANSTWDRQESDRQGAVQDGASALAPQTATLVLYLLSLGTAAAGLFVLLFAAALVDLIVTLAVLVFGGVLFVVLRPLTQRTKRAARRYVEQNSTFGEGLAEWTGLARDLRVFGVEGRRVDEVLSANREVALAIRRTHLTSRLGTDLYRDIAMLFLVGAVGAISQAGALELGSVGAVVLLVVRALSYAQQANGAMQSVNELAPNLSELTKRIASLESAAERRGMSPVSRLGDVELVDVGYSYGGEGAALVDINLYLDEGDSVGVIGPSGGGKSTLAQILLRLRTPTVGTVRISGLDYREIADGNWRALVSYVPQEPHLFEGTIAENIAFYRPALTDATIERSAAAAHIIEEIRRLPRGFDTRLGPRGAGLSGGQRQRIAIARALAGDPQLLVLDEPTSALDVQSEELLQQTIRELKGRITLVIVAHRLSTLEECDRVLALRDGRVVGVGSLPEMVARLGPGSDWVHERASASDLSPRIQG